MNLSPLRKLPWKQFWPVVLIMGLGVLYGMIRYHHRLAEKGERLQTLVAGYACANEAQAAEAFDAGDFRRAAALLEPAALTPNAGPSIQLLRARALECLGRFSEAADSYSQLLDAPAMKAAALRGRKFSQRMGSERQPVSPDSREHLYRLHSELMERGDLSTARLIARRLLPDVEPMRHTLTALLRPWDPKARVEGCSESGRLDIAIHCVEPQVMNLLRDLKIETLSVPRSGLDAPKVLATLDVLELDLSHNGFSDLSGVRALPLRCLHLKNTRTVDLRPLAGMPLRELDLSSTMVEAVAALSTCPLSKLNLSSTAVRDLSSLRGLALRELDLSNTGIHDLEPLSSMPLEHLNLTGTRIWNLKAIAGARLKSLSLAGTAVKDLAPLANMPLVELDLRGCELLSDCTALSSCASLERVYLPRHVKVPADRWGLPQLRIVQEKPANAITLQDQLPRVLDGGTRIASAARDGKSARGEN